MAKSILSPEERLAKRREYKRRDYEKHREAILERNRQWAKANPEKTSAIASRSYKKNREKRVEYTHQHYEQNKEKILAYQRQWRQENPEKARDMQRRWNKANPEKLRAKQKRYEQNNPDAFRAKQQRYKDKDPDTFNARRTAYERAREARKLQQMPKWAIHEELLEVYENRPPGMQVDHIVPLLGLTFDGYRVSGLHTPENLQYLEPRRNFSKKNKMRLEDHIAINAPI